ncbi:MAG: LytTR family transcriptional regulator [Prevotella sp.]|nr:LytTR family transcriptional regulator [Prevotella sp.]MBQ9560676.1 LytTR family transcriptional regulator [Prevotella sp.]MBR1839310.1 LytTR family transcriptional regulator [Prevotella sp.]
MTLEEALHKIEQQEQKIDELRRELRLAKLLRNFQKARFRERFFVNTFKGEKVIDVAQVRYFVSENKSTYIVLHDGNSFVVEMTLTDIMEQLDPHAFMRVNRKYIVPILEVAGFERDVNGKERLVLKQGNKSPEIIISRDNKNKVHEWIEGDAHTVA